MSIDLTIIIVTWNSGEHISGCLTALLSIPYVKYRIIVVDNKSTDNTLKMIKSFTAKLPQLTVIANQDNFGFAKANNQAINYERELVKRGEWVVSRHLLLLNPDTELIPISVKKVTEYLDKEKNIGILGPKIINQDGSLQQSVRNFPTLCSQVLILTKIFAFYPRAKCLQKYWAAGLNYGKINNVDQVMGACFYINRQCLEVIGLLDENFFVWFEEVDFCKRARDAQWRVTYLPIDGCVHYRDQSFRQLWSWRRQWYFQKSLIYFFKKYGSGREVLILRLLQPFALFLSLLTSFIPRPKWLIRA